ncbi:MAG TPA: DUF1292 domain-containing protein [Candidatus Obscuribacterales bacterium]
MQANNLDEQTITLESEDGRSYACRILGVFEFDNKEYALLLNLGDGEGEEESKDKDKDGASTVIMQLIEQDDQAIFRTIESDEEFDRVVAYVKELAMDMADEDDEEE